MDFSWKIFRRGKKLSFGKKKEKAEEKKAMMMMFTGIRYSRDVIVF